MRARVAADAFADPLVRLQVVSGELVGGAEVGGGGVAAGVRLLELLQHGNGLGVFTEVQERDGVIVALGGRGRLRQRFLRNLPVDRRMRGQVVAQLRGVELVRVELHRLARPAEVLDAGVGARRGENESQSRDGAPHHGFTPFSTAGRSASAS
jgi:hypothetical protein